MPKKVSCIKCNAKILPYTYEKTGGYCTPCFQFKEEYEGKNRSSNQNLASKRRQEREVPYRKDQIFSQNKSHKIVSLISFAALFAAIGISLSASSLQEKSLLAVRGILLVTSLYMMFHCWYFIRIGKVYFRGFVIDKNKDKVYYYVIIGFYLCIASMVLTGVFLIST